MSTAEEVPESGTGNTPNPSSGSNPKADRQADRIYKKAKAFKDSLKLPEYHGAKGNKPAHMLRLGPDGRKKVTVDSIAKCGISSLVYRTPETLTLENPTREDYLDEGISVHLLCPQVHIAFEFCVTSFCNGPDTMAGFGPQKGH